MKIRTFWTFSMVAAVLGSVFCLTGCGSSGGSSSVANIQQINGLSAPVSVRASSLANVLICDQGVVKVYNRLGTIFIPSFNLNGASNGTSAFTTLVDAVQDAAGTIYILDAGAKVVDVFKSGSSGYTLFASFGNSGPNQLSAPKSISVDTSGNVYILDTGLSGVQVWNPNGSTYIFNSLIQAGFKTPTSIAIGGTGKLYVADSGNEKVYVFTTGGTLITSFGTSGTAAGDFKTPVGVDADPFGNIYVADSGNSAVDEFVPSGNTFVYSHKIGARALPIFQYTTPIAVSVDTTSNIFILDSADNTVSVFPPGPKMLLLGNR